MCLENVGERLTAKRDIVCYKRLFHEITIAKNSEYHGKDAVVLFRNKKVDVVISIYEHGIYFCSDYMDGTDCPEKFGKKYSWVIDESIKDVWIDGESFVDPKGYKTPYQKSAVEIGETYDSELIESGKEVEIGLHSFKSKKAAKNDGDGVIVKCIIPKGAEYYIGYFDGETSYASTQLKYVEVVE